MASCLQRQVQDGDQSVNLYCIHRSLAERLSDWPHCTGIGSASHHHAFETKHLIRSSKITDICQAPSCLTTENCSLSLVKKTGEERCIRVNSRLQHLLHPSVFETSLSSLQVSQTRNTRLIPETNEAKAPQPAGGRCCGCKHINCFFFSYTIGRRQDGSKNVEMIAVNLHLCYVAFSRTRTRYIMGNATQILQLSLFS